MTTQTPTKTISLEKYLAREEQAIDRHEYIQGEVRVVPSECLCHSSICGNLMVALATGLKSKPYNIFHAAQRLWIPSPQVFTYPDVMVTTKPLVFQEGRTDTVLNACLIAEVLSPSTTNYDRSEKFQYYRSIPEFQEYLLIEQDRIYVEHFYRLDAKKWSLTEYTEIEDVISFGSVGCEISLADIYED
jgi:Uma2 family endonuclease